MAAVGCCGSGFAVQILVNLQVRFGFGLVCVLAVEGRELMAEAPSLPTEREGDGVASATSSQSLLSQERVESSATPSRLLPATVQSATACGPADLGVSPPTAEFIRLVGKAPQSFDAQKPAEGEADAVASVSGEETLGLASSEGEPLEKLSLLCGPGKEARRPPRSSEVFCVSGGAALSAASPQQPCLETVLKQRLPSDAAASNSNSATGRLSSRREAAASGLMETRAVWRAVMAVLLTWVQDPLLSLVASSAAARLAKGASLAVAAVGAGGQVSDGLCLLLAVLGVVVGALCSRALSKTRLGPPPPADLDLDLEQQQAKETPSCRQSGDGRDSARRIAAVGVWLAGEIVGSWKLASESEARRQGFLFLFFAEVEVGVCALGSRAAVLGLAMASFLWTGSRSVLGFFLNIRGFPRDATAHGFDEQHWVLDLAVAFSRIRCVSLPFCVISLTTKAALLTMGDSAPQLVTVLAVAAASPLLYLASASASGNGAQSATRIASEYVHQSAQIVAAVQVIAALFLLHRLGLSSFDSNSADSGQTCAEPLSDSGSKQSLLWVRRQFAKWGTLYQPPKLSELKAFSPFILPSLTQCFVR